MQAALLMTEELLGFLVRPSYYRKLICKHTLHPSHEPRRDATGRDTSFGSRAIGIESGLWADDRCKMFSYHKGSLVTLGLALRALLGRPDRLLYVAPVDRAEAHLEAAHQRVQSDPLTHKFRKLVGPLLNNG